MFVSNIERHFSAAGLADEHAVTVTQIPGLCHFNVTCYRVPHTITIDLFSDRPVERRWLSWWLLWTRFIPRRDQQAGAHADIRELIRCLRSVHIRGSRILGLCVVSKCESIVASRSSHVFTAHV